MFKSVIEIICLELSSLRGLELINPNLNRNSVPIIIGQFNLDYLNENTKSLLRTRQIFKNLEPKTSIY